MPALTAAISLRIGKDAIFFSSSSFLQATVTATIAPHRAGAELLQINHAPQRTPDQSLNFGAPAIQSPLSDVALFPCRRGIGQHRILGCEPAASDPLVFHPARHDFLDRYAANDAGVSHRDEN